MPISFALRDDIIESKHIAAAAVGNPQIATGAVSYYKINTGNRGMVVDAWVNFNGVDMTIRNSYNVVSVTDDGTGLYTVNLSKTYSNSYVVMGMTGTGANRAFVAPNGAPGASSVSIACRTDTGADVDNDYVFVAVIGTS